VGRHTPVVAAVLLAAGAAVGFLFDRRPPAPDPTADAVRQFTDPTAADRLRSRGEPDPAVVAAQVGFAAVAGVAVAGWVFHRARRRPGLPEQG
jgi:hypothetical protein